MYYPAVPSTGDVLIIRDSKVIGKGKVAYRRGDDYCGIKITEGDLIKELENTEAVKTLGIYNCSFRYFPISGIYCGDEFFDTFDHEDILDNTMIVDEFNLKFRMVPEWFSEVEGYGKVFD